KYTTKNYFEFYLPYYWNIAPNMDATITPHYMHRRGNIMWENEVVAWASKMGKTPIVVNDCPGFFVNRVLFPYFAGFSQLLRDGA
ncbi:hypothetical protein MJM45_32315, partial [Salmonella enterica subsp. enterica serovar Kentucky]|nr:hypothetical protein [Salmonella enterica subsp. enterica serovar Kentucky]